MPQYVKSKKVWRRFLTRKDWVNRENSIPKGKKKRIRKIGNKKVRSFKNVILMLRLVWTL
jgi:hypothetical protein